MTRGIAVVRRDNFTAGRDAQRKLLDRIMGCGAVDDMLGVAATLRRAVRDSLDHVYDASPPPTAIPLSGFVQTGSLSKPMTGAGAYTEKDVLTRALAVARSRPEAGYGLGSRVPWVVVAGSGTVAARSIHPDVARAQRPPLDADYYMQRVDAVLATLLAPIMAEHRSFVNSDMRSGAATRIRAEHRKGDRDQTPGIVAAKNFLATARGGRAPVAAAPPPPEAPASAVTFQRGVDCVRIVGDADGRVWATGAAKSLATLPWDAVQWEGAGNKPVSGRHNGELVGWEERLAQAAAAFPGWRRCKR